MNYWKCMVLLSAVALMSMVGVSAYAQVVALHEGDNDPTTEGTAWSVGGDASKGSAAAGPSWRVNDVDQGNGDGNLLYQIDSLPFEDALDASGWEFTINSRSAEVDGPTGTTQTTGKTAFSYWTANYGFYRVSLNHEQGTIRDPGALNFNVEAGANGGNYVVPDPLAEHEYRFLYNGTSKLADIFVDDVLAFSGVSAKIEGAQPSGNARVEWGAEQSGEHGDAFYSNVSLRGIPEPTSLALTALGCGMLGIGYRRRKR